MDPTCDLVLPCRDEGRALEGLLPRIPEGWRVIVVDNGSRDDTAEVATRLGARVVRESLPGYGAAVHAGCGGRRGGVPRGHGRRRVVRPGRPAAHCSSWSARAGRHGGRSPTPGRARGVAVARPVRQRRRRRVMRRRIGLAVRDIAPMRVCRRQALLDLDLQDRRFGYPVELLHKATAAGWRILELDVAYHPRAARHPLEGVRLGPRHRPHRPRLLRVLRMTRALVLAKAPVAGRVKTRLGAEVGMAYAAELAAAALLDSLEACADAFGPERCWLSLSGDLAEAVRADELLAAVRGWTVVPQRGGDFGERLVQRPPRRRRGRGSGRPDRHGHPAGHRRRPDGGRRRAPTARGRPRRRRRRWLVGARAAPPRRGQPHCAAYPCPRRPPASTPGLPWRPPASRSATTTELTDVDTVADADAVAALAPNGRFAAAWRGRTR